MTVEMTEKQKREIMRKGAIASTKIIEKLEIRIEELEKENEELKEHKANLIRADKKKTEYIDELEKQKIEKKLLFVVIGVFIGIVIAVICYSHDLENMCLRLFNS